MENIMLHFLSLTSAPYVSRLDESKVKLLAKQVVFSEVTISVMLNKVLLELMTYLSVSGDKTFIQISQINFISKFNE